MLDQVSVGTLLAFTIVGVSILILRYVPPAEVLPPSRAPSEDSSLHGGVAAHLLAPQFVPKAKPVTSNTAVLGTAAYESADFMSPGLSTFSDASLRTLPRDDGDADTTSSEDDVDDTATIQADEEEPASAADPETSQEDPLLSSDHTALGVCTAFPSFEHWMDSVNFASTMFRGHKGWN